MYEAVGWIGLVEEVEAVEKIWSAIGILEAICQLTVVRIRFIVARAKYSTNDDRYNHQHGCDSHTDHNLRSFRP